MSILTLQNVSKEYVTDNEHVRALSDVSLTVQGGEFVALVGRSGCGKSTLLNLAGAMDTPTSGTVTIDGQVTTKLDEQSATTRKAFADQKLLVDTISTDLRVVREKVDDNNVRVLSLIHI